MSDLTKVARPFAPDMTHGASTVSVTSSGASASVALPLAAGQHPNQCMVYNSSGSTAFINFGTTSGVTATAPNGATSGGTPVPPGALVVYTLGSNPTYAAAIVPGATNAVVYFTPGIGN